jgi:hypothetical protein
MKNENMNPHIHTAAEAEALCMRKKQEARSKKQEARSKKQEARTEADDIHQPFRLMVY